MRRCYYKILGVSFRATQDEIRRSFRILALRYHPDRNPEDAGASERFREAVSAYETLVDTSRRAQYDRRKGLLRSGPKRTGCRTGDHGRAGTASSYEDLLEELFGVRPKARSETDLRYDLRFDLQVHSTLVREGGQEEISFARAVFCPECKGNHGAERSSLCRVCGGSGEVEERRSKRVFIPAGLGDGSRLRMQGWGDCLMPGRAPGDLVIVLHVAD